MNIVASLIVRNEFGRYLEPCIRHLQEFCDEIRVYDDGSTDGTFDWLMEQDRVQPLPQPNLSGVFFKHEGRARNTLLDWTLNAGPSHILAIDADEFVSDGQAVRRACERDRGTGAWTLVMEEVWKADPLTLQTREDGGWRQHPVSVLWRVPAQVRKRPDWRIADRALACGREPAAVRRQRHAPVEGVSVLHFGWTCEQERRARYQRYATHDGGRFHASAHLRSILMPDQRIRLRLRSWPDALDRDAILERVRREAAVA